MTNKLRSVGSENNKNLLNNSSADGQYHGLAGLISGLKRHKDEHFMIKLDYHTVDNPAALKNFAENAAILHNLGIKISIVHDDKIDPALFHVLGFDEKINDDYIRSNPQQMGLIYQMILCGYINKKIVAALSAAGLNAVSFSGRDGGFIEARKIRFTKSGIRAASKDQLHEDGNMININLHRSMHRSPGSKDPSLSQSQKKDFAEPAITNIGMKANLHYISDLGFHVEPENIDPEVLIGLDNNEFIPVISPTAFGQAEESFVVSANLVATIIASALNFEKLIILSHDFKNTKIFGKILELQQLYNMYNDFDNKTGDIQIVDAVINAIENFTDEAMILDSQQSDVLLKAVLQKKVAHGVKVRGADYLDD